MKNLNKIQLKFENFNSRKITLIALNIKYINGKYYIIINVESKIYDIDVLTKYFSSKMFKLSSIKDLGMFNGYLITLIVDNVLNKKLKDNYDFYIDYFLDIFYQEYDLSKSFLYEISTKPEYL